MKKRLILCGILLFLSCSFVKAEPTIYLSTDTVTLGSTYYILINRDDDESLYDHTFEASTMDTFVKQLEITISSNTTEGKIGYIYSINASSANVYWFDRALRNAVTDKTEQVNRKNDPPLRLSSELREFKMDVDYDSNLTTTDDLYMYDISNSTHPEAGDIIFKTTSSDANGKYDIKIIYYIR